MQTKLLQIFKRCTFVQYRPLNGRLGLHAAVWLQAKVRDRGLGLRSRLYVGPVCDGVCGDCGAI